MYKASPVIHAKNLQCPFLINIGTGDRRVPPQAGLYVYKTLKMLGKENVHLNKYENEGHGLSGFEANGHFVLTMLKWFKKYLK